MNPSPFAARLAQARDLIARGAAPLPLHVADQLQEAAAGALRLQYGMSHVLPLVDPARGWRSAVQDASGVDKHAYLLAALLACRPCPHLRPPSGPRPAVASLPLRRVDCYACYGRGSKRPVTAADECDLCERRGVTWFSPFVVTAGPVTIGGDACPQCATVLGIADRAA